jgi:lipocalin
MTAVSQWWLGRIGNTLWYILSMKWYNVIRVSKLVKLNITNSQATYTLERKKDCNHTKIPYTLERKKDCNHTKCSVKSS